MHFRVKGPSSALGDFIYSLAVLSIIVFLVGGWILNIIALIAMIDGGVTAAFVLRVVGVFIAPLGAILGWFM